MTFNVVCCVGTALDPPRRFSPNRGVEAQVVFGFGIESDSQFGVPALREATLRVFVLGRRAEWVLSNVVPRGRLLVKGRIADLDDEGTRRPVIVADWVEIIRRGPA